MEMKNVWLVGGILLSLLGLIVMIGSIIKLPVGYSWFEGATAFLLGEYLLIRAKE